MAIGPVTGANVSTDVSYSSGVATGFAVNAGASANRYMVAFPLIDEMGFSSWHDDSQSYNAVAMTPLHAQVEDELMTRPFGLANPASGSNTFDSELTDTFSQNPVGIVSVDVYEDVDVSGTPVDNIATATTGTDATINITGTTAVGDMLVFMGPCVAFSPVNSAPTNYTERWDNINGELLATGGHSDTDNTSVDFTATIDSAAMIGWVGMAFNLNVAAGGGGGGLPKKFALMRARRR